MRKIGLLSDTHSFLDPQLEKLFENCDEIWHAGDIGSNSVTQKLAEWKPLKAVHGNIDGGVVRQSFPEFQFFEIDGLKILMIHIAGSTGKYNSRVRQLIKDYGTPDVLVCGHSHILKVVKDPIYSFLYMNPGAAGVHGFHKIRTALRFDIENGRPKNLEVIELGVRGNVNL